MSNLFDAILATLNDRASPSLNSKMHSSSLRVFEVELRNYRLPNLQRLFVVILLKIIIISFGCSLQKNRLLKYERSFEYE